MAGNETTKNLIGNGLLALLQHPDQLARVYDNPELIPSAIEELLRYDSPVQMDSRVALEDLEIGGKQIKRGQEVVCLIGSANRDSDTFSDPDTLFIDREPHSHVSFGRGIHHCLGAQLAHVEGHVALRKLVQRYPSIRLAGKPRRNDRVVLRGLHSLPRRGWRAESRSGDGREWSIVTEERDARLGPCRGLLKWRWHHPHRHFDQGRSI